MVNVSLITIIRYKWDAIRIMTVDLRKYVNIRYVFRKSSIVIQLAQKGRNALMENVCLISGSVLKIHVIRLLYAHNQDQAMNNAHNYSILLHLTLMFVE